MKDLSKLSLKHQIALLIGTALVMMTITYFIIYLYYYRITEKSAETYFNVISSQLQNKTKTEITGIKDLAKSLIFSANIQRYLIQQEEIGKFLFTEPMRNNINYAADSNSNIDLIKIIRNDGTFINSSFSSEIQIHRQIVLDYNLEYADCKESFFTKCYEDKGTGNVYYAYVAPIYTVLEGYYSKGNIAVCIIFCQVDKSLKNIPALEKMPEFTLAVTNDDFLVSSYSNQASDNIATQLTKKDLIAIKNMSESKITYKGIKYIKLPLKIEGINWDVTCIIKVSELVKDMIPIRYFTILMVFLTAILLFIIGFLLISSITKPITQIVKDMDSISKKNIKKRINIKSKNEIGFIADNINVMLDELDENNRHIFYTQNALYEAEIERKHAELAFYQNQINPHFLYNTLECMRSIGQINNINEITVICGSMAKIFRYSVKERSIVSIKSELECVEDYFNIMSIRYMGSFSLKIKVDATIKSYNIIKMTLQPLVENCIIHGFSRLKKKACICVCGYFDQDSNIMLKIVDNGKGIEEVELENINSLLNTDRLTAEAQTLNKTGVGLFNINHRIKLSYGPDYGISVTSRFGHYTSITLKIPGTR